MIENVMPKCGFSLLKWLPAVAVAAFVVAVAPKAAMAQATGPDAQGYVVTGCDITSDNGTYSLVGTDYYGNPYYANVSGAYLYAGGDDQEGRPYYYWYMGKNVGTLDGYFIGLRNDDYSTNMPCGPDDNPAPDLVTDGPATVPDIPGVVMFSDTWSGDNAGNSSPVVTAVS